MLSRVDLILQEGVEEHFILCPKLYVQGLKVNRGGELLEKCGALLNLEGFLLNKEGAGGLQTNNRI